MQETNLKITTKYVKIIINFIRKNCNHYWIAITITQLLHFSLIAYNIITIISIKV